MARLSEINKMKDSTKDKKDSIKDKKLIYHITTLDNFEKILERGLLPRSHASNFMDIADHNILQKRKKNGLDECVPFHWFAKNPFDGRVQTDYPKKDFVLISVYRDTAKKNNWKIIPHHPLATGELEIMDYTDGFSAIDWETMDTRDYHNEHTKSVCMAECLAPGVVPVSMFAKIFVKTDTVAATVRAMIKEANATTGITVNPGMFISC
ncbi:DarT ssDNA thymidine ADP-ribosyltransferase family protein [Insolitispirillum peregrinum]|uniref:DarT domain-containing protein n=1 Tax=Insolitispirillum peregrinum TaxID=80876 RepID=A0A1N7NLN8_9PROT|nr:DarT ssDNA thymidine ADP-ribosyltransferase family protein [Insolitispirillum peregrinum]SIS99284.1 protein of unknown function [Insolitispirillum peregrinum]